MENARLKVELATTPDAIRQSQKLRYQIFAEEMGAKLSTSEAGLDIDSIDDYCHHLIVTDSETNQVIASTRILTDQQANRLGRFYSDSEFDLSQLKNNLNGKVMEIGRTCVHPQYRNGATIATLWSGLARFMVENQFDFLIGCASVDYRDEGKTISAIMDSIKSKNKLADPSRSVYPKQPLPTTSKLEQTDNTVAWPPLLKAYLRLGAKVCGEPCLDLDFQVADIFILLDKIDLSPRYARHFINDKQINKQERTNETCPTAAVA